MEDINKLIQELESSYPKRYPNLHRFHPDNRPFEIHHTKIRDAYWKRRMIIAKLENLDLQQVAKIY